MPYYNRLYAAWLTGLQFHPGYPQLRLVKLSAELLTAAHVLDSSKRWVVINQGVIVQGNSVRYCPFHAGECYASATEALRAQLADIEEYEFEACCLDVECPDDHDPDSSQDRAFEDRHV